MTRSVRLAPDPTYNVEASVRVSTWIPALGGTTDVQRTPFVTAYVAGNGGT